MIRFLIFTLLFSSQCLFGKDFNITDYGAIGDGVSLNTKSIQDAIDAAHQYGPSRVVVPEGRFLFGSIDLKSNVELHLMKGAVLLGSLVHSHYRKPKDFYQRGYILARDQNNIAITGQGEIDGQGRKAALHVDSLYKEGLLNPKYYNYVEDRPRFHMRPMLIIFVACKDIRIENITLKNAASWVQHYDRCKNLTIKGIHVDSDAYWNNDGLDISDSKNVRVSDCYINSADDGITLKSHFVDDYMDSVFISNCVVRSSASAIKFGTKSEGGFKNVTIEDIFVFDTYRSAIAIESVDGGFLENVLINNICAVNTGNAIFIRLGHREPERQVGSLKNITLKNIWVEVPFERPDYAYDIRGPALDFFHNPIPSSITGMPGYMIENLSLENIHILYPGRGNKGMAHAPLNRLADIPEHADKYPEFSMFGELPAWAFYVRHVKGLQLKNINVSIKDADYRPAFVFDDVQDLQIESLHIEGDSKSEKIILKDSKLLEIDSDVGVRKL